MLEWLGIPFTGSPFQTLCLARSKHLTKVLLQGSGPADAGVLRGRRVAGAALSARMAGDRQAGGAGRQRRPRPGQRRHRPDCNSTSASPALLETYGPPVLVEQFIRGREFNVGLIETPDLRRAADLGDPVHRRRPGLLADRDLRRQVEAGLARLRVDAAVVSRRGRAALASETRIVGQTGVPSAGLPRLRPRRFPGASGQPASRTSWK